MNFYLIKNQEKILDKEFLAYVKRKNHWTQQWKVLNSNLITNNNVLGDFLVDIVDVACPMEEKLPIPKIPNHLPLKITILGSDFSGKKTVANFLKEKFGLEIINPEKILNEAMSIVKNISDYFVI